MGMEPIVYNPIGVLRTPFADPKGGPIQPRGADGAQGRAELLPELAPALADLEGFSHVILIYHCHRAAGFKPRVTPFLGREDHGLFSTRAPARPNPIGLSVVALEEVQGSTLLLRGVDMLDHSPLLDVKPYVPGFDHPDGEIRTGWLGQRAGEADTAKADDRFA
ncbi:MAG: tRNA (N6-threonylcarbamoyladenosine(37)-N6)-methyltransferase TrmO [Desulfarculaceae bacterium]|nr:tRNA (N6-threonylcarbamoyladenosine(37)-N6)-methyltransferase TrmO [Desulfarculaceae bacterium]